jgi:hypothetical protein
VDNKTLTIVLCQTRESSHTFESLRDKVLSPLSSDLAFCGNTDSLESNKILENSQYVWNFPEPENWASACDKVSTNESDWRTLCKFGNTFLGGSGYADTVGSGLIIMYWREILRIMMTKEIISKYEWFVVTRSDFKWVVEHPQVNLLREERIYFLDGEKYGGVSDRHIIFHRTNAEKIFSLASPIFHYSKNFATHLEKLEISELNPERYIHIVLNQMGAGRRIHFLPYLGFTIRHEGTQTRWSSGSFSKKHNCYIKYPTELRASSKAKLIIKTQEDWELILSGEGSLVINTRKLISKLFDSRDYYNKGMGKINKLLRVFRPNQI